MKFLRRDDPFGALIDRHQEATGHRVYTEFWSARCTEADCRFTLSRGAWGNPFQINGRGGFHLHWGPR